MQNDNCLLEVIRLKKPLVHHITNQVTMNFLANGILAAGGSPMMAHHAEEAEEAASVSDALVLNIGTIEPQFIESMILAGKKAKELGIPVAFDPVGAGLSNLRKRAAARIADEVKPDVICGNAAEITYLLRDNWEGKGVDGELEADVGRIAEEAALTLQTLIVITGKVDIISDGKETLSVSRGHEILTKVTGTGCFATSLLALFLAKSVDSPLSRAKRAQAAMEMLGISAEKAWSRSNGPGTFQASFLDELYLYKGDE